MKTMSSHRIYIVFELGANGCWPVPNGCSVGRDSQSPVILCIVCPYATQERRNCQKLRTRVGIKLGLLENLKCIRWDLTLAVAGHFGPLLRGLIRTHSIPNIRDGRRDVSCLGKLATYPVFFLQKRYLPVCGKAAIKQIAILSLSAQDWFKTEISSAEPRRKGRAYLCLQLLKDHRNQLRNHEISQNSKD